MKFLTIMLVMLFSLTASAGFQKFERLTQEFLWDVTSGASADSTASSGTIAIFSIPAGAVIYGVSANVETVVAGSTSEIVGDGDDDNGYLLDAFMNSTGLTPLSNESSDIGVYSVDTTNSGTSTLYRFYSSADTIDLVVAGSATAGKVRFFIDFSVLE